MAEAGATNPERKSCRFNPLMDCIALATHTRVPSGVTLTGPLLNHALLTHDQTARTAVNSGYGFGLSFFGRIHDGHLSSFFIRVRNIWHQKGVYPQLGRAPFWK